MAAAALIFAAVLRWTALGRSIKAVRSNPELAGILGIEPGRMYLIVFAIAGAFAGLAGFWSSVQFSLLPSMGFKGVVLWRSGGVSCRHGIARPSAYSLLVSRWR